MAYNVNFLKGTAESFASLATKNVNTFYYIDEKDLYIGNVKLTNGEDLVDAVERITVNESDIQIIKAQLEDLTGGSGGEGDSSVTELISALTSRVASVEKALENEISRATTAESELSQNISNVSTDLEALTQLVNTNETDIEGKVSALSTEVQTNKATIEEFRGAINSIGGKVTTNENNIKTIQGDIDELEGIITTLVGSDTDKSVRAIAIEVLVEQLLADGNTENFETLQQLAAWLADHPEEAAEMNLAIQENATNISKNTASIADLQRQINEISAENGLLAQAKEYTDTQVNTVTEALNSYKTITNSTLNDFDGRITANEQAIIAINNPTTGLLAQMQKKLNDLSSSLGTAAYKNVEDFDAAGSAAAALNEAKAYTDAALTWGQIEL